MGVFGSSNPLQSNCSFVTALSDSWSTHFMGSSRHFVSRIKVSGHESQAHSVPCLDTDLDFIAIVKVIVLLEKSHADFAAADSRVLAAHVGPVSVQGRENSCLVFEHNIILLNLRSICFSRCPVHFQRALSSFTREWQDWTRRFHIDLADR